MNILIKYNLANFIVGKERIFHGQLIKTFLLNKSTIFCSKLINQNK